MRASANVLHRLRERFCSPLNRAIPCFSTMNPPSRRVLSSKDTNSHLSTRSPGKGVSDTMSAPVKAPSPKKPSEMTPSASSPVAGTKRKIHEVEEAERVDEDVTENDSQRTQLLSDTETEEDNQHSSTSNHQISYETAGTSCPASQNIPEPQFELQQDEMSQRTLEKLHNVPLPQNTSQLPPSIPFLRNEMSAGSIGLSNFFNFDGPASTQNSDQMELIEIAARTQATIEENQAKSQETLTDPAVARRKMLDEKAQQLRTRLQLAMFKVQTKQTTQPFSRLKYPKPANRDRSTSPPVLPTFSLTTPTLSSSTVKQPSSTRTILPQQHKPALVNSAEEHIAAMRARAANQQKPPVRNLNSLPMPRLDPQLVNPSDSFTTQLIEDDSQHFPSSPPLSRQSSDVTADLPDMGPETQPKQLPGTQLSSPPVSEGRYTESDHSNLAVMANVAIATQGEAASGLVKLMTGE